MVSPNANLRAGKYGGDDQRWWGLLNEITAVLGSTKSAFWPFFENTGQVIAGLGAATSLVPRDEAAARALEAEWTPRVLRSGVHFAVKNVIAGNNHFSAGENAAYSFTDDSDDDDPLSFGMWVAPENFTVAASLIAKYVGAAEEYDFRIDTSGLLELELHDVSASASFTATSVTGLTANKLQFVTVVYDGNEAAPGITFYVNADVVGAAAAVESGTYLGMEDTATPLLVAARGLTAAPAQELGGWMAMPFVTGIALTAADVELIYEMQRQLVGT